MQDESNCFLTRSLYRGSPAPILCLSCERGWETYTEIDDLLQSSLCQSRCLSTLATSSAFHQMASTSALGGAPALPSPDLAVDEIDTLAEVDEVAAVQLAEQITRCSFLQSG